MINKIRIKTKLFLVLAIAGVALLVASSYQRS